MSPACTRTQRILVYNVATIQASGNVDNEGLIGRAQQNHHLGYRRVSMFRRLQADLGLLLSALGVPQRHAQASFSFLAPWQRHSRGGSGIPNLALHIATAYEFQ